MVEETAASSENMECQEHESIRARWTMISTSHMADLIRSGRSKMMVVDSRSFLEYNTSHVIDSVNLCCSKLVKRRLQQGKVFVRDMLNQTSHADIDSDYEIYVYDQCTVNPSDLATDCFLMVLLSQLVTVYATVRLIKGGFLEFQASHPSLCETKSVYPSTSGGGGGAGGSAGAKNSSLTSLSQPCMPVSNVGPTRILPFLYLGSQQDAMSQEILHQFGITYVLNVSSTCPKPPFIPDEHFMRIPVNDTYCEKLLPHFQSAFQFLDKVRESGGCVLVHCLAGISRSPTLAIAYVMRHMGMSNDEAYKYVKDKRQTISPNFNFLGQLLEYEKQLQQQQQHRQHQHHQLQQPLQHAHLIKSSRSVPESLFIHALGSSGTGLGGAGLGLKLAPRKQMAMAFDSRRTTSLTLSTNAPSPTTALSRLTFGQQPSPVQEESSQTNTPTTPSTASVHHAIAPFISFSQPTFCSAAAAVTAAKATQRDATTTLSLNPPQPAASAGARLSDMSYFPQVPTSFISKINFMPCSAREEVFSASNPSVKRDSGGSIKRPARTSLDLPLSRTEVTRSASAHNILMSSTFVERSPATSLSTTHADQSSDVVQLRSPEAKAKRPLVRPSSIGIMSTFAALSPEPSSAVTEAQSKQLQFTQPLRPTAAALSSSSSSFVVPPAVAHPTSLAVSSSVTLSSFVAGSEMKRRMELPSPASGECLSPGHCTQLPSPQSKGVHHEQPSKDAVAAATAASSLHLGLAEQQARISRSLEDLLNSADDSSSGGRGLQQASSRRHGSGKRVSVKHDAGGSGAIGGLDIGLAAYYNKSDVHQSSSSISSAGSRSSLHGSHEMIEVS